MTSEQLIAILVEKILGWRVAPARFLTGDRQWISRWRFQPLTNLDDAFRLLETAATSYTLRAGASGGCFSSRKSPWLAERVEQRENPRQASSRWQLAGLSAWMCPMDFRK